MSKGLHVGIALLLTILSGVAVQSQIPGLSAGPGQDVYLVIAALGRDRFGGDPNRPPLLAGELVPGLHWQESENRWLSGGLIVPLGPSRGKSGLWQITYSWRY